MHVVLIGYLHHDGGIQTHSHWLAKGLVAREHSVEILTPGPLCGASPELPADPPYTVGEYWSIADVWRLSRAPRPPVDAVVIAGTGWKAMALALAIRPAGKRIFFEVMSGVRGAGLDPRDLVHLGFDAIVAQGSGVERVFLSDFNWQRARAVIPALPEPLEIVCGIPPAPVPACRQSRKLNLAYFGRLVSYKGAGFLIDNWSRLARYADRLDIWGSGPAHDEFAASIAEGGLGDWIALKGRYPRGQEYVDLLQTYDMTLLPTWGQEGAPLVLLESMACGVPFVANGVGGIPDYANPQCEVTSGDVAEFLPCYERLAERICAGDVNTAALQAHYRDRFSYERLVDRWETFLASPLPTAHGAP